jgi:hypothetical protein
MLPGERYINYDLSAATKSISDTFSNERYVLAGCSLGHDSLWRSLFQGAESIMRLSWRHRNCRCYSGIHDTGSFERNSVICDQLIKVSKFKYVVSCAAYAQQSCHTRAISLRLTFGLPVILSGVYNLLIIAGRIDFVEDRRKKICRRQ